jgi:hypothetical protein
MAGLQGEAVDAGAETFRLPRMALPAVHRRDGLVVIRMLAGDVGVTTDAIIGFMHGQFHLGRIHKQ